MNFKDIPERGLVLLGCGKMGSAMLAAALSRLIARPLYDTLARQMVASAVAANKKAPALADASGGTPGDAGPTR
mgnify:CR=1 FL=1